MAPSAQAPNIFEDTARVPTKPSVLRSILSYKAHRRYPSADDAVPTQSAPTSTPSGTPSIPPQVPLGERAPNRDVADGTPSSGRSAAKEGRSGLHKKTKSAVSLKSLRNYMERKDHRAEEPQEDDSGEMKPKKTKSANSLTAILKRSQRGRKGEGQKEARDKENRSPSDLYGNMPSPCWTEYMDRPSEEQSVPRRTLEKGRNLEDEVSLYTPKGYSPAQQRNFYDYHQPSLTKRSDLKPRPKSDCVSGNRKVRDLLAPLQRAPSDKESPVKEQETSQHRRPRGFSKPEAHSERERKQESAPREASRVQAAISAFNAKGQHADLQKQLDSKDLEGEFEKLLDSRNIPHNMRDRMRSLDTNIKADFIQKDRTDGAPQSAASSNDSNSRRGRGNDQKEERHSRDGKGSRSRSRSRGFSFSKGGSPTKKQRPDSGSCQRRPKSLELSQPIGLSRILTPSTSMTSLSGAACVDTAADPSDFVHYLREIQKPEMIDVGKLHKLRILLRNETVGWVDDFITEGGMDEVVQLLYRIMKVEWRGEHEDTLLHEALLCLKALGTTSAALKRLTEIEPELFSALLKMLFDEENKGPSEFTTRGIIVNLLFTQLSTAPSPDIAGARALRILSYLRDPTPPEESQPLSFIANIYQSRPYRLWCKEVTNVTKEVFWIFLHHVNVIQVVSSSDRPTFRERHFPAPRPPVPAAPYVGGVEWDATNYLAAHLDLMNGLIACLPTADERNSLRTELRASGFEKVMGGSLRTCKEKFYSSIHDCLRTWIAAAVEDQWPYMFVREGPPRPEPGSPTKSPTKAGSPKKAMVNEKPPKLDLGMDLPGERRPQGKAQAIGNWL